MKEFEKIHSKDPDLVRVQGNVEKVLSPLLENPLLDGILLENVKLRSGADNFVPHKLGRVPQAWILAKQDTDSRVWQKTSQSPKAFLNLWCSSDCTVSLWVT